LLAPGVDAPTPWANCERILLSDVSIVSPTTLCVVRRTFLTRSPVVYEIDPTMQDPRGGTDQREVWDVAPNMDLVAEATWRLACSNAVDARDVSHPTWPLAAVAMKVGASLATGRDADVVLPDGTFVWCDGGPLQLWEVGDQRLGGVAVGPRGALISGLLTPVVAT